jgi:branched-chain amino acid transport system permease protein
VNIWTNRKIPAIRFIALGVIVALLILLPIVLKNAYIMHLIIMSLVFSILGMTFSMIYSTGRINLGAATFFIVGAYASTILVVKFGLSFWVALPLSAIISGVLSLVIGLIISRGSGLSFGITMMLFGIVVTQVAGQIDFLGGWAGFTDIPAPDPIHLPFLEPIKFVGKTPFYYLILSLFLFITLCFYAIYNSRVGRAWRAIKLSSRLAETIGINLYRYRVLSFVVCSIAAGLVGSYFAHYNGVLQPAEFGGFFSINIQLYSVLGGLEFYIIGPVIGAVINTFVPEFLRIAKEIEPMITGVLLVVLVVALPGGILGTVQKLLRFGFGGIFMQRTKEIRVWLARMGIRRAS